MGDTKKEDYWMSFNSTAWVITLVISFFVFFPAFIALTIIWLTGRIKVIES
jgi:hypothetical protein